MGLTITKSLLLFPGWTPSAAFSPVPCCADGNSNSSMLSRRFFMETSIRLSIWCCPKIFEEPGYVCRLRRSLYGLKQAPLIWYQCVHRILASHGFTMAQSDNRVFYKPDCVVSVYLDDFLVSAADTHGIEQLQRVLQAEFRLNDLGTPRSFVGIQFDYHIDGPCVSINHPVYPKGSLRLWY